MQQREAEGVIARRASTGGVTPTLRRLPASHIRAVVLLQLVLKKIAVQIRGLSAKAFYAPMMVAHKSLLVKGFGSIFIIFEVQHPTQMVKAANVAIALNIEIDQRELPLTMQLYQDAVIASPK